MATDDELYAPSVFMSDYDHPAPETVVNAPLPRGTEGGLIETTKRAVVTAIRTALTATGMSTGDRPLYIDQEYPMKELHYPGVWVQFSITKLNRAGIGHEVAVEVDDQWCTVQEWMVEGRVTVSVVGLKNKDRDRISDAIIAMLAFSRPPEPVLTNAAVDTKQNRSLFAALAENPHMSITLNTDVLYSGGQGVNVGTPFSPDMLAYEDSYSFDLQGQFNTVFRHDGTYTLTRVDVDDYSAPSTAEYRELDPWSGPPPPHTL
ncbi:hypothetical protein SEA_PHRAPPUCCINO_72 [Mycobacterium phage Phrappuccino]|uniref:Uncharacterized protein n=1 Tax=Mycobacterium phage Phrappuccino TaxID=2591223 RepID=A0A514DDS1_9CAUD|nr:hypothetical protein KHQ87_gp072 [Mycobacterium phage Phrappuccino]QDH91747.1 hypothetical protein SEA_PHRAPPUCCINO_72 [Mycobacterium phage Phrappuccino]QIQ63189.1 hypothetical protein SEA_SETTECANDELA_72 [Mycobacterium phage Settecandela]